ncbi:predicted protein [Thalassiosira pseudonana CCMP1335]|uniref:Uncharacterized protein n=1 Tax=Thalassiosira pseudonana TaxID=35128 RepID=B8CAV9_THAPS|nr:predicted protein [Thalassiosira pseudonana CCMP1335]EED89024.1 predicted protein [Thalassiosira pseudonana CCMP1335]
MNYLVSFGKPKPSIKVHSNQEVAKTSFAAASSTQPFPLSLRASESILKRFDSLECRPQPQSRRASSNSSVYQLAQARRYSIDEAEGIAAEIVNGYSPPGPSVSLPEVVKERKPLSISAAIVQRRASERALSLGMCRYSKNLEKYHVLRDYQVSPSSLPPKRRESVTFAEDVCFANCTNLSGGVPRRRRSESVTAAGTAPSSSSLSGMSCTRRASESQLVDAMSSRRVRFATISELAIVERPSPEEITNKWYSREEKLGFHRRLSADRKAMAFTLTFVPADKRSEDMLYECIGLEASLSADITHSWERKREHRVSVLSRQSSCSDEELSQLAQESSEWAVERAANIAQQNFVFGS